MKSLNSSGHKRSRLPVVQGKSALPNSTQLSSSNSKFGLPSYSQYASTVNTSTSDLKNCSSENNQLFARRNLFQPQVQQFGSPWAVAPVSDDGEVESQGQESVRKFCTEDTPLSLSKAGSNTNLSSLTFDDDDHSRTGHGPAYLDAPVTGEPSI